MPLHKFPESHDLVLLLRHNTAQFCDGGTHLEVFRHQDVVRRFLVLYTGLLLCSGFRTLASLQGAAHIAGGFA